MHIAESVAREKGILRNDCITHGWWKRFLNAKEIYHSEEVIVRLM